MNCPRCKTILSKEKLRNIGGDVEIDKCNSCEGIWFDYGELSKFEKVLEPTFIEFRHIPKKKEQLKALFCPKCENLTLLQKADHSRDRNVIIDYCQQCKGIWLDYGELEAIQKDNYLKTSIKIFNWLIGKEW